MEIDENLEGKLMPIYNNIIDSLKDSDRVQSLNKYMKSTDFFDAPASTVFHHAYQHGLLKHCLEIYKLIGDLSIPFTAKISDEDRFILAFGHDLSKTNYYKIGYKNKKINNKWEEVQVYEVEDKLGLTHEVGSIHLLKDIMDLPISLEMAILYHHGAFNQSYVRDFSAATRKNPYVLLLHTADMLSSIIGDKDMEKLKIDRGY